MVTFLGSTECVKKSHPHSKATIIIIRLVQCCSVISAIDKPFVIFIFDTAVAALSTAVSRPIHTRNNVG